MVLELHLERNKPRMKQVILGVVSSDTSDRLTQIEVSSGEPKVTCRPVVYIFYLRNKTYVPVFYRRIKYTSALARVIKLHTTKRVCIFYFAIKHGYRQDIVWLRGMLK